MTTATASTTSSSDVRANAGPGMVSPVDGATAKSWLDADQAVLVDVREPFEHAGESIPGATLVPLGEVAPERMPAHEGKRLIIHCKSGMRSDQACRKLAQAGLTTYNLTGGIEGWAKAGLPTDRAARQGLDLQRQTQLTIGLAVLAGTITTAVTGNFAWLWLTGFFGAGLTFAGLSGLCPLANLIARMPWNRCGPAKSCCAK